MHLFPAQTLVNSTQLIISQVLQETILFTATIQAFTHRKLSFGAFVCMVAPPFVRKFKIWASSLVKLAFDSEELSQTRLVCKSNKTTSELLADCQSLSKHNDKEYAKFA